MRKQLGTRLALFILTSLVVGILLGLILNLLSSIPVSVVVTSQTGDMNACYDLTPAELQREIELTNKKDSKAAYRLWMYYGFAKYNMPEAKKWLKRSADLGYGPAQDGFQGLLPAEQKEAAESAASTWPNNNPPQK